MTKLLIATTNTGKVIEIAASLAELDYEVLGLSDLPHPVAEVEETGTTFMANALLKAEYYHQQTGLLTLADDSGLAVDALGGRPGVHSARYAASQAGALASDATKVARLLAELRALPTDQRTAQFVCVIALVGPGVRAAFTGTCAGLIAPAPRGTNGFGYDPIFLPTAAGLKPERTFAEITRAEKAAISHRGQALAQLKDWLRQAPLPAPAQP